MRPLVPWDSRQRPKHCNAGLRLRLGKRRRVSDCSCVFIFYAYSLSSSHVCVFIVYAYISECVYCFYVLPCCFYMYCNRCTPTSRSSSRPVCVCLEQDNPH